MNICWGHAAADFNYAIGNGYVDTQNEAIISEPWCVTHGTMKYKGYGFKDTCK